MQKYRFGVLLPGDLLPAWGDPGHPQAEVWAGPSGRLGKPLVVTGALFLQRGNLAQSCFPGQVPRVSLLPPTSFLQFCGYLWVCTAGTPCCMARTASACFGEGLKGKN